MEQQAQEIIEEADCIEVQEPVDSNEESPSILGDLDTGLDMELDLPDMGLGIDF